jgi:raffinose/stachyose/melibiose transport system permease protein
MTAGGPNHHSEVLATYLFLQAFRFNSMGLASVIAIVIVVLSLTASIIRMKIMKMEV